ncbi:hypothetical protein ABX014_21835 [Snodgrassella alvi]|uniref:hypothetical protein n=1 Tax=Snodgrassella alvi TaxID=1196083 RepID=UPI00351C5616
MFIDNSLRKFAETFQNSNETIGIMQYSNTKLNADKIDLPLAGEILYFYDHIILEDGPILGNDLYIRFIEKNQLKNILDGWDNDPEWKDSYIIFAERNGDVLLCDSSDIKSPVYGSVQMKMYKLTDSLSDFLDIYSNLIKVEEVEFGGDVADDDFNHKPEYLLRIEKELNKNLSSKLFVDNFMYFFFG